jgi:hypothetical protein
VGLILGSNDAAEAVIEDMACGGPAYNCKSLVQGDVILQVDDEPVDVNNCYDKLVGNDTPGSLVKLIVRCVTTHQEKVVMLTRISSTAMLNNVRMFEIFTSLKDHAYAHQNQNVISHVEDGLELWTLILHNAERESSLRLQVAQQNVKVFEQGKKILHAIRARNLRSNEMQVTRGREGQIESLSIHTSCTLPPHAQQRKVVPRAVRADNNLNLAVKQNGNAFLREERAIGGDTMGERAANKGTADRLALKNLVQKMENDLRHQDSRAFIRSDQ